MNALEELKYYCEIDNPVGALLLTGEWGCGKTYLIEHSLKDEIKDECYILRVSLFGISSVDEINNTVKRAWLNLKTFGVSDKLGKVNSAAKALSSIAAKIPRAKNIAGIAEGVLSIDIMSLISVENEINNKKVIMVFDDLERSNLNTLEVLGAINEYCENQHFNVIVVADENKIKNENSKISYKEIKEKVVQRTIFFKPDYDEVVRGIIDEYAEKGSGYAYGNFLMEQSNNLVLLFSGRNTDAVDRHWCLSLLTICEQLFESIDRPNYIVYNP